MQTLEYKNVTADFVAFSKHIQTGGAFGKKAFRSALIALSIIFFAGLIFVALIGERGSTFSYVVTITYTVFGLLMLFNFRKNYDKRIEKHLTNYYEMSGIKKDWTDNILLEIRDTGLFVKCSDNETVYFWKKFTIEEIPTHIFIFTRERFAALTIPRNAITSGHLDEFVQAVRAKG